MGQDYISFYDSTMARFWFFKDEARLGIRKLLETKTYGRILTEQEKKDKHVYFEDNMYGELLFLVNSEVVINPSNMGHRAPQGMHGYDVEDGTMDGIMVSHTPYDGEVKDVGSFFDVMLSYAKKDKY